MSNMNEKKSPENSMGQNLKNKVMDRTTSIGMYVAIVSVIFIAVVVIINLIVTKADITGDLSDNKVYSLTKDTEKFLDKLKDDIII